MNYNIELVAFEGPMDLLLHLIKEAEIDIYDIPINLITEQFIEYIDKMQSLNLEVTSEFIVMAASLLEIKSKMLLPKENTDDTGDEEIDPREELVERLIEYKKYKSVTEELKDLKNYQSKIYTKPKEDIFEEEIEMELENIDVNELLISIKNILRDRNLEERLSAINEIRRDRYNVDDFMNNIINRFKNCERYYFSDFLSENTNIEEVVTLFLAVLELIKENFLEVKQKYDYSDLILFKKEVRD